MTSLVRLASVAAFAAAMAISAPAQAGSRLDHVPLDGVFVQEDACSHAAALSSLHNKGMTLVAELPRTDTLWRFLVDYKQQYFGASVHAATSSCRLDLVNKVKYQHPWCEYLPGIRNQCPMTFAQ